MKKGLLALLIVVLCLAGMVANAAIPEMWGMPDVIIGDLEDTPPDGANTDFLFVFPDAFDFDDYVNIISTGTLSGLKWHFLLAAPADQVITINGSLPSASFDLYGVSNLASFRNVACSPVGGSNTLNPVGFSTTSPIIVTLRVKNSVGASSFFDDGSFTVFTLPGENDSLTNEFYAVDRVVVDFSSNPGWTFSGIDVPPSPGIPSGISSVVDYGYDATTDALWLQTTGIDHDYGSYAQAGGTGAPIPYVDGNAYILTAQIFAVPAGGGPVVTPSADNIPWIRLRVNTAKEAVSAELNIQSPAGGSSEVSMDPDSPSTEVLVFDPLSQMGFPSNLRNLYVSFDLLDFAGPSTIGGDEEGLVGIAGLEVDTFPVKMLVSTLAAPALVKSYPAGTSFATEYSDFNHVSYGFGGTTPEYGLKDGNLMLRAGINVAHGACWHELNAATAGIIVDPAKWYWYKIKVKGSNDAPWVRLRVFTDTFERVVNYNLRPTGDGNGSLLPGGAGTDYNVFFVPQAHYSSSPYTLGWAFDYIDFSETTGYTELQCSSAKVYSFTPPAPAP